MTEKLYNLDIWIYNRVKWFSDNDKECFESNKTLSEHFGRHQNRVSASITKLKKEGYIKNNGTSRFNRRLVITGKPIDISSVNINNLGVSVNNIGGIKENKNSANFNINGVSVNNLGVSDWEQILSGLNKNGVAVLTKAVLGLNKNGDIYKQLSKHFNKTNSVTENNKKDNDKLFDKFYTAYPLKKSRQAAAKSFAKVIKTTPFDEIMAGLEAYNAEITKKGTTAEYIKHPSTWLNNACWQDEYDVFKKEQQSEEEKIWNRYIKNKGKRDMMNMHIPQHESDWVDAVEKKRPDLLERYNARWGKK